MPPWTPAPSPLPDLTVGKHAAPEGAAPHPLVSEALAHRTERARGSATEGAASEGAASEGEVGWPGPPVPDGGGLGWPKDVATADSRTVEKPVAPVLRGRWRRFFGASRVA